MSIENTIWEWIRKLDKDSKGAYTDDVEVRKPGGSCHPVFLFSKVDFINTKYKIVRMETPEQGPMTEAQCGPMCENCAAVAREKAHNEEASMAFLLALVPVLTLTFFGQMGLL